MKKIVLLVTILGIFQLNAQIQPPFTPAAERMQGYTQRQKLAEASLTKDLTFRNIGPWVQSGRVVDIDVNPADPSIFYVAFASGSLWKTESNGSDFTPLFDNEAVMTIGDIAVDWQKNIIWIGTGENNSSRSSYAGAGMYRSDDGGKTWQHRGLEETHHIGRIIMHPTDPNTVWVAALGHLYSPNKERGIYKTTDGGKTWQQTLFVGENAGAIDLIIDPSNPNNLYTAIWERERRAWRFEESGKQTGIYKSSDGGNTWALVSNEKSGFPADENAGRIGLATAVSNGKTQLFAIIDNQSPLSTKAEKTDASALTKEKLQKISKEAFLALDKKVIKTFLDENGFLRKYKMDDIVEQIKSDKITPQTLYDYIDNGDDGFGNKDLIQCEVYRSDDNGATWQRTHTGNLKDLNFTYGYYFGQIRVNEKQPNKLYIIGTRIAKSDDGGKNWQNITKENVHWDGHALWVNPNRAGHLIYGNDGGINISYDDGKTWFKCNTPSVAQFYHVAVDMSEPYNVYGGLQDNGVWYGDSKTVPSNEWHDSGENPYKQIMGGDGMQTQIDTRDNATVYTGYQFGQYFRLNTKTQKPPKYITPKHELGEKPLRFNWQTPILLSSHNQDVLYFGANKLYRSFDKGDTWERISDDLTKGGKKGNVPYGTLTTIHESPLKFGLLYTGSDDGLIQVSRDGGNTWKQIVVNLPQDMYVSRVQASQHNKSTVYAALNGYRWDDFGSYLYASTNYGDTWQRIGTDLPAEPINVVKEDPKNANILYVGTDHAVYISFDAGKTFTLFNPQMPAVAVHDLVIHPRDNEIVVGTHGRSLYIANVANVQKLTAENLAKKFIVFDLKKLRSGNWGTQRDFWSVIDTPQYKISTYSNEQSNVKITVKAGTIVLKSFTAPLKKGLNETAYNLTYDEKVMAEYQKWLNDNLKDKEAKPYALKKADNNQLYLQKGEYTVEFEQNGTKTEKKLIID